jgi:polar amino acid transport system permease protein
MTMAATLRLLEGAGIALGITFATLLLAFPLGIVVGLARLSPWRLLRFAVSLYVEVFRGTSAFVQLFYAFFVLPLVGISFSPVVTGIAVLTLNVAAYASEVVRASVQSVESGQRDAASALNMSRGLAIRRIILPQAFVRMLPPFGNQAIELLKGTSLLSTITISELSFRANGLAAATGRPLEVFSTTLLMYLGMALPFVGLWRFLERTVTKNMSLGRTG